MVFSEFVINLLIENDRLSTQLIEGLLGNFLIILILSFSLGVTKPN